MSKKIEIFISYIIRYYKKLDKIEKIWHVFLIIAFFLLIRPLFVFTIIDSDFYKDLANKRQKMIEHNPSARGTISSSAESTRGIAAVSTNLWTLAIDPTQTGSTMQLLDFLSDAVLMEFCSHKPSDECRKNISNYTRQEAEFDKKITRDDMKKNISEYLEKRMKSPVESVFIAENLNDATVAKINSLSSEALFFVVNNLYVNPTKVNSPDVLADRLSRILQIPKEKLLKKMEIRPKRHLEIIRSMSVWTRDFVDTFLKSNTETVKKTIDTSTAGLKSSDADKSAMRQKVIIENAVYPFVKIEDNFTRFYPEWATLGQITGFVDAEGVGRYGVEWYFENDLQWENPTKIITKDVMNRPIRDYASTGAIIMKNGINISLTIDRNIQKEISKKLEQAVKSYRANKASVIVTNPKTGAIIAMANYPSFDPNQFTNVHEMEQISDDYTNPIFELFGQPMFVVDSGSGTIATNIDGKRIKMREATEDEIKNDAIRKYHYKNGFGLWNYQNSIISDLYEPGSVFKSITTAIGLDTGEIRPNDTYYDRNYVELDTGGHKQRISNLAKSHCGGRHTFSNALNWSCNVGMITIVEKVGRSLFDSYIRNFWFGSKAGVTLDGEVFSEIDPYQKWPRAKFFTMSFGQGISVTMLQMAAAYNVLANGGLYMKPYIVESIEYPDGKKIQNVPNALRRVISEDTSKTITAMMVDGVKHGFAAGGAVQGYAMAWKTGTSQIPYKGTYENHYFGQDLGHTITSYGGFAPAYNPKFVMIVMVDRPRSSTYAEKTAAALYADIAAYMLNYYKVPKWQE